MSRIDQKMPGYAFVDLEKGQFAGSKREDLTRFFQGLSRNNANDLVVHFHGGLVGREAAHTSARRLSKTYDAAGVGSLFFVWNTDLGTTLKKNLLAIAREAVFWTVVSRVRSLVMWAGLDIPVAVAGIRGSRRPPLVLPPNETAEEVRRKAKQPDPVIAPRKLTAQEEMEALQALERDGSLQRRFAELAPATQGDRGARAAVRKPTLMSPELLAQAYPRSARGARAGPITIFLLRRVVAAAGAVIKRYLTKTHHGLYPTVVEEVLSAFYAANVGRGIWSAMKANAVHAFEGSPRSHAGAAFVADLIKWWAPGKKVTLVGHSAGSIFIVELMQRLIAAHPSFRASCVLLAPACTFERFATALPDLRKGLTALRIFNLSDELERGYWEVPVLYSASLLYLVSGILENNPDTALIGMQRYYSGEKPYTTPQIASVRKFLEPALNWAPAKIAPARLCNATKHGGFDQDAATLMSLASIVKDGIR